ncbi:MAG: hypothetical protein NC097_00470 [Clostridium sp.]|nr:hypothetical protein [Prevotella sp.]MCM1428254.1 hypothetical protein [Clostridium sp.]MCM1474738.1 hypothetical protein [Muribaculaceae bacterium]
MKNTILRPNSNRNHRFLTPFAIVLILTMAPLLSACFTGIESTKKVEMGREDRRQNIPTAEEVFLDSINYLILKDWEVGKKFLTTDDRLVYILDISGNMSDSLKLAGSTLTYEGIGKKQLPDGSYEATVEFSRGNLTLSYPTGKLYSVAIETLTEANMPMLISLDMVRLFDQRLKGLKLYTRSDIWYEGDSTRVKGQKFVPVEITGVTPGITEFPLKVSFKTSDGKNAFMFMNSGSGVFDSRSFANNFSLNDIRIKYPRISDEVWNLICNGKVAPGMTKEECKLSLGNPSDLAAGHSYSQTLDIWQYPDGKVLHFADGLLVDFRH